MSAVVQTTPGLEPGAATSSAHHLVDLVYRFREHGIVAVLALFVITTTAIQPRFLNVSNIKFTLLNATIFGFLALGQTVVIVSRNVDLSVGSVLGLSAYLSSAYLADHPGTPIVLIFALGLAIGLACGVVNGAVTALGRVPSLVVTIATLYIIRGIDTVIVGGKEVVANSLPNSFLNLGKSSVVGIPDLTFGTVVVLVAGAYFLRHFRSGRELYAIGSNPDAARLAGIATGRRVFAAFVVSGGIAGLSGVMWAAYYGTIDSTAGTNYELQVVAACVVGGVAIFGGSGSAIGAAFGALLIATINQALYVLGISSFWEEAIYGLLLLVAISLDRAIALRLTNALRKRRYQQRAA